ncbi:grasp-with-spasm system SPASM domain peptide maturase [Chitinophaga lutea]|uniref:Grasp-with-spasm system SPASM domain peptide maturase n=1 Tax=Chitinophaga lutea TaxID=2488634 RepID=A0A3N4PHH6_9BACT|nr:grasp-with-spasm system SPASM domain peptide maturase [Chitinophaga lutea]RPE08153.1 grasp-with-spasm system SPASM domain peptide maturase [Chitinophaga lutea]
MTKNDLPPAKYFYLFADLLVTKGFTRTLITDTSRQALHFIDNSYYEALMLCRHHTLGEIAGMMEAEEDVTLFHTFIGEMLDSKMGALVDDIALFPEIEKYWDHPSVITNAIIDIRDAAHDFDKVFSELDQLGCEYVEIRSYREQTIEEIERILKFSAQRRIKKLFFLTRYSDKHTAGELGALFSRYTFLALTLYATPAECIPELEKSIEYGVAFVRQEISSAQCCGNISFEGFQVPKIKNIMENFLYNGCLNRKISIDENGQVKNCPSMKHSYGHIDDISLRSVVDRDDFRLVWGITKEKISECADCEYRSICTDCRVFIKNENDIYSKPSKCKYDPYSGRWAS